MASRSRPRRSQRAGQRQVEASVSGCGFEPVPQRGLRPPCLARGEPGVGEQQRAFPAGLRPGLERRLEGPGRVTRPTGGDRFPRGGQIRRDGIGRHGGGDEQSNADQGQHDGMLV